MPDLRPKDSPMHPLLLAAIEWAGKKEVFEAELGKRLATASVELRGLSIGRNALGRLWILTVRLPWGSYQTLHAPIANSVESTHASVAQDIAQRVEVWVSQTARGRPEVSA